MRTEDVLLLIGLFLSIGIMWLDFSNIRSRNKKIILCIIMFCALMIGYAYFPLSPDFYGYKYTYYDYVSGNFNFESVNDGVHDYGFLWICELTKSMGGSFYGFYLVVCALSLYCCYDSLLKYTTFTFSAWFLLFSRTFYENNVNQIREGLAICIFIFALRYVVEKDLLKFIIMIIVASLVHKTLIIGLCIYPINNVRWNVRKIILFIVATLILYLIGTYNYVLTFATEFLNIGVEKLASYSMNSVHMQSESTSYLLYRSILLVFLACYLLRWRELKYTNLYISMLLMAFGVMIIFSDLSIFSSRLSAIYSSAFCFALPELYRESNSLNSRLFFMAVITVVGITFFLKNHFLSTI